MTIPEANFLSKTLKFSQEYSHYARYGGNMASLTNLHSHRNATAHSASFECS